MSRDIYVDPIVLLARRETGQGRLAQPRASVTLDNPLCGDRIILDVDWRDDGTITRLGYLVRGCLLCRASASVRQISSAARALEQLLLDPDTPPPEDWPELSVFTAVHSHSSRYDCVLLPFHALLAGLGCEA